MAGFIQKVTSLFSKADVKKQKAPKAVKGNKKTVNLKRELRPLSSCAGKLAGTAIAP